MSTTILQSANHAVSPAQPAKELLAGADWGSLLAQVRGAASEAFDSSGNVLNLKCGEWGFAGHGKHAFSPVDGCELARFPMLGLDEAKKAVHHAGREAHEWSLVDLDERKRRVSECLDALEEHQELLARLLVWEIGKPLPQARVSVERCISGVRWYVDNIEGMLQDRAPLGLVSNIASWNYPLSVLMHAVLVQVLCGNSAIAKTPSDGGLMALTLSFALARRAGLPVSLVSGSGGELSEALVRNEDVACLSSDDARFTPREQMALKFAELFVTDHFAIDDAMFAEMGKLFTKAEIIELGIQVSSALGGGRLAHVLRAYEHDDQPPVLRYEGEFAQAEPSSRSAAGPAAAIPAPLLAASAVAGI